MNDNAPACTRLLYIDTLSRFVGPFLGFGVVNFANENPRAFSLPSLSRGQTGEAALNGAASPISFDNVSSFHAERTTP